LSQGTDFAFSFQQFLTKWASLKMPYVGPDGFPLVSGSPLCTGALAGQLGIAILPDQGGGVQGIFQALSSLGDATRVAQFPMTTLNNKPVSRRVGRDRSYVASVQNTTSTGNTGDSVSSTITPGTIREGFNLQLTPRLLQDGRILMQYSLSITDLVDLRSFGDIDSGSGVQLPETASRVFVQQSLLKSGSTLVLAGVDDEQTAQNASGVGSPFNFLLGGGSSNVTQHSMMFIAITPQVVDVASSEQG
jgi:type IVB pilus formation R64 PilN family outer membrane protein